MALLYLNNIWHHIFRCQSSNGAILGAIAPNLLPYALSRSLDATCVDFEPPWKFVLSCLVIVHKPRPLFPNGKFHTRLIIETRLMFEEGV